MFVLLPASDSIDTEMLSFADFIIIPQVVGRLDKEKKLEILSMRTNHTYVSLLYSTIHCGTAILHNVVYLSSNSVTV